MRGLWTASNFAEFPCPPQLYSTMYCKHRSGHQRRELPADQIRLYSTWTSRLRTLISGISHKRLLHYVAPLKTEFCVEKTIVESRLLTTWTQRNLSPKPKAHLTPAFERESIYIQMYPDTYSVDGESTLLLAPNPPSSQQSHAR